MKLGFVLDPLERLDPAGDTSVAIIEAAGQLGHEAWVVAPAELALIRGQARGPLRRIRLRSGHMAGVRWTVEDPWYELDDAAGPIPLDTMDAVFIRTDPPFDRGYLWATWILDFVDRSSTILVNDPRGIRDANEKLFALRFGDLVPPTIVSADAVEIRRFTAACGRTVAKPVDGHAGRGVVQLRTDDSNLASLIELMTARGTRPAVFQEWLDEASSGNKRILLWEGELLGAVNRPIEPGDFRTGAPSEATELTDREHEIVARLGPTLRRLGLRFVGLDTIGGQLIEVNVTSPGGIREALGLGMPEIARDLIRSLERDKRAGSRPPAGPHATTAPAGAVLNRCGQ